MLEALERNLATLEGGLEVDLVAVPHRLEPEEGDVRRPARGDRRDIDRVNRKGRIGEAVAELDAAIPSLSNEEVIAGLTRILAQEFLSTHTA